MDQIKVSRGKIVPKFDTYSAVWQNSSIRDIFNHYMIGDLLDTFVLENERICIDAMNIENWHLAFNGIRISFKTFDVPTFSYESDLDEFLDAVIPKIRFELNGKGCDYMTLNGISTFEVLRKPLPEDKAHVTRIDIAYDLVDYMPDFQRKLKEFCLNPVNQSSYLRLAICNLPSGTTFSLRAGDQETVYIGAPTSDKLLRVYDKYLQKSKKTGVLEESPYGVDIKSWIRIEWQLRNKKAHEVLFGRYEKDYFTEVFKKIYENYRFRDLTKEGTVVAQFWEELFDWNTIPSIILNLSFVEKTDMQHDIKVMFERSKGSIADFLNVFGWDAFIEEMQKYYRRINIPLNDSDYAVRRKRIFRANAACGGNFRDLREEGRLVENKFFIKELML